MSAAAMATKIVDNLKNCNGDIDAAQETLLINCWTEICQGIIDEIIAGSVVETTVTVSGGSSAGTHPGVGTVTE